MSPISTPDATSTSEPSLKYDLLFLSPIDMNNYTLMYWNHTTGETRVLLTNEEKDLFFGPTAGPTPSRIVQYSLAANNRELAVARMRDKPQGANAFEEYDLALFDLDTQHLKSLATFESPVYWVSISPDGKWLAYILVETTPASKSEYIYGRTILATDVKGGGHPSAVYALRTDTPEQHVKMRSCDEDCGGLSWSPDSLTLAWSDKQGVWSASVNEGPAQLIAAGRTLVVSDGKRGIYAPPAWSPNGRYLLARSQESEVGTWGVIDAQTGRFGALPDSREYPRPNVHSVWLNDGRLFVVRHGESTTGLSPLGELWKVDPENKDLLILDRTFVIPASPEVYPTEPTQFDDGRLAFILLSADDTHISETGLYIVGLSDYTPRRISEQLPKSFDVARVFASWLPDGMGALIHAESGPIYRMFAWANDFLPSSMPQVTGDGTTCCFTWIR